MTTLLDETPEAAAWVTTEIDSAQRSQETGGGHFASFVAGVFTTNGIDTHGHQISADDIRREQARLSRGAHYLNVAHDPTKPPIGRILASRVFTSPDGTLFLAGVVGVHGPSAYTSFAAAISADLPDLSAADCPNVEIYPKLAGFVSPIEFDDRDLEEIYASAPSGVFQPDHIAIRKAATSEIAIVTVIGAIWAFGGPEFGKKYFGKLGEASADATLQLFRWVGTKLREISRRANRRVLFEFITEYRGCKVEFVIDNVGTSDVQAALAAREEGTAKACRLVNAVRERDPSKLTMLFDATGWEPLLLITERDGVITDRPYLQTIEDFGGFSIGGVGRTQ